MFVTAEDFNLEPYNLPNLDVDATTTFPAYITDQEEIALTKILGRLLYTKLATNLALDAGAQLERFKDIRDGKVYTHNGIKYYWCGLKKTLRPYIYCLWTRECINSNTGIGIAEPKAENSVVISPAPRMSRAYNDFALKIGGRNYPKDSLYGLLFNSESVYLTDVEEYGYSSFRSYLYDYFKFPGMTNSFGL